MPFKFLPAPDDWEKALAGVKVKPDSALSKALEESWKTDSDQPAKRMAVLPKIQKLAMDFKKSKNVTAGGPNAIKLVQDLIDVIPVVRKNCEQAINDFKVSGTPTFFVNGKQMVGEQSLDELSAAIDPLL